MNICDQLIDVKAAIPTIVIDLKYATDDNFAHQKVYDFTTCYLHEDVIKRLRQVQKELSFFGYGLKIWDGYRPMYAQEKFWQILPDENYVAHPTKGSRHTRGTAVDCTLIELSTQIELPMPSQFDDFSECAHKDYTKATDAQKFHRDLLIQIMENRGFVGWLYEWWHFDLLDWQDYPVLDFTPKK